MPRIDDRLLNSVVYLYKSAQDAKTGYHSGGSGFLIAIPSKRPNQIFTYVVTNSHVVRESNATVVRLNKADGSTILAETMHDDWWHHPDGDDVAVAEIAIEGNTSLLNPVFVGIEMFITDEAVREYNIGPGDEVFLAGRLINHDGRQRNVPSVRFGSISMLPTEPIPHPRGIMQESFLVELFSLEGYSGGPVFVYFHPFSLRPGRGKLPASTTLTNRGLVERNIGPLLLGVNWGHIHHKEKVIDIEGNPVEQKWCVKSNSGMAGVVPAWKIKEILYSEELEERRMQAELR